MQERSRVSDYARDDWVEDELDLRAYVALMLRRWWWIVGAAVLAAVAAFTVSSLTPPTYQASSVVLITPPRYRMQSDERSETVDQWQLAYETLPELATSDEILGSLIEAFQPSPAAEIEEWSVQALTEMVEIAPEGEYSLVKLTVSCRSPEDAAGIANVWADELVNRGNQIYTQGEEDVSFFQRQTAEAKRALEQAEQALIAFQARNRASIVSTQLSSYRQTQSDYLADQRAIAYLIRDIQGLRDQLARHPSAQPASLGDELTSLLLQVKAFNAQASTSIELQVDGAEAPSQRSRAEQIAFLEDLMATLEAKSAAIEERLTEPEPKILERQEELQQIETEEQRLVRARALAEEAYVTLSRKLQEARIAAQEGDGVLQVGSYASVPEEPVGPRRLMNTALAAVVGGMIGLGAVLVWDWWAQGEGAEEPGS